MLRHTLIAGVGLATLAIAQTPIALPPFGSTYTANQTRGFWFTCPVPCIITGLESPNEGNLPFQVVEVLDFGTTPPPVFAASVAPTAQLFYDNSSPTGQRVPCNVVLTPGNVYGIFGSATATIGAASTQNSYGTGPFTTNILGNPVVISRLLTQSGIASNGGNQLCSQSAGSIGRVYVDIVPAAGLYANFTSDVQAGPVGQTVNFTDATYTSDPGGVTSWTWDLDGDGTTDSTLQNPSFTYGACGAYDVSLTVTDSMHPPSTETKIGFIQIGISPITPSFTFAAIVPGVYQFTDTSTPTPSSWAWDLDGDGTVDSTSQNPVWAYTSPCTAVNVTLSVSSTCAGPWSVTQPIVAAPLAATAVPFTGGNGTVANPVGNMFDLTVTNPDGINVCAITQGIYTYVGPFSVDIYLTEDTYIGKEANASAWRLVASGAGQSNGGPVTPATPYVAALNAPFYMPAGNYGMAIYLSQPAGNMNVSYTNGPLGPLVNPDVTFFPNPTVAPGRSNTGLFTGTGFTPRCWNGTLHYTALGNGDEAGYGFFGTGCAGSLGVPGLTPNAPPVLGTTMTVTLDNLPTSSALMMTGFSNTTSALGPLPLDGTLYGAPGCQLRISPDANLIVIGAGNTATWSLTVPLDVGLIGVLMFNQAVAFDPNFNAASAVVSDAYGMMMGN